MSLAQRVAPSYSPEQIVAEVARLYRQLQALPAAEKQTSDFTGQRSAAYVAIEAEIRGWAERFWAIEAGRQVDPSLVGIRTRPTLVQRIEDEDDDEQE